MAVCKISQCCLFSSPLVKAKENSFLCVRFFLGGIFFSDMDFRCGCRHSIRGSQKIFVFLNVH